jgi:general stress protein 26
VSGLVSYDSFYTKKTRNDRGFEDFALFLSSATSICEIERMPNVNVSFIDTGKHHYVSISGMAELVRDRQKIKELWKPVLKAWFPDGPEQADIALLKVVVTKAEYWDGPSSTIAQAISFVSAIITGKQVELGENKKVQP